MKPFVDIRTLGALILEWSLIVAIMAVCIRHASVLTWLVGIALLATRQHALLMLYHDAVHGLLARSRLINDFMINVSVGVPFLLPIEVFRPLHMKHHRQLGAELDPERTILFASQHWQYKPLLLSKLLRQLFADLFVINAVRSLVAWQRNASRVTFSRSTWFVCGTWVGVLLFISAQSPSVAVQVLLLWTIPALSITNLLQKIRSFAEHGGVTEHTGSDHEWTYSWRVGWLGRLTIWPYNINRHREHHAKPGTPWHQLPVQAAGVEGEIDSKYLLSLLWRRVARSA